MHEYQHPGVYLEESGAGVHPINGVSTSDAAFVDVFREGPLDQPIHISGFDEFVRVFGGLDPRSHASYGIQQFFQNGGRLAWVVRISGDAPTANAIIGTEKPRSGMSALAEIAPHGFSLMCVPATAELDDLDARKVISAAESCCSDRRAFLIVDIPAVVDSKDKMITWMQNNDMLRDRNAAVYFPQIEIPDPLAPGKTRRVAASGTLAGLYARTDTNKGIWKAPAGTEATLKGVSALSVQVSDADNGALNKIGVNCLRSMPKAGLVARGARTLMGDDRLGSEWKYVPVRRLALYLEASIHDGMRWVVFEPNDEPLWARIRLGINFFLQNLFREGAFQGSSPQQAFFVKCDRESTSQSDIDAGVVNVLVGFAPLKPAEFIILGLQLKAGSGNTVN